jgi:hypothetical protein
MAGADFAAVVSNVAVGMATTFAVTQTLSASTVSRGMGVVVVVVLVVLVM